MIKNALFSLPSSLFSIWDLADHLPEIATLPPTAPAQNEVKHPPAALYSNPNESGRQRRNGYFATL
jgi:hypothetical protein